MVARPDQYLLCVGIEDVLGNKLVINEDGSINTTGGGTSSGGTGDGHVTVDNASIPVTGAFFQATQPVSGTFWQVTQPVSFTMPALVAGSAIVGKVGIDQTTDGTTNAVHVNNFPATQPMSAVSLPLPSGAATSAKQDSIVTALGSPLQAGGAVSVSNFPTGFLAAQSGIWTVAISNFPASQPVTGTFWPATQPVSIASMPSTPVTGPLTDAQLRATAVPVSQSGVWTVGLTGAHVTIDNVAIPVTGTFWQATQPVSGTFWQATQPVSGPLTDTQLRATTVHVTVDNVSIPVTGAFFQATQPVSIAASVAVTGPLTDTQLRATAVPVSIASVPTHAVTQSGVWAVGVTGTFWQATQPVSIASMPSTPVTGTFWQATQPVSGTFWQATQPVSIASMPSTPVTGTFWPATQPISAAALPLPSGAAIETGNLATLVSQLAFQLSANRQPWSMSALLATGATSETLLSSVVNANGVAAGAANTYTVPVGKTLRISSIEVDVLNTTTVANRVQVNLRGVASGTMSATSPLLARVMAAAQAALAAGGGSAMIDFPEGLCLPAGWSIGLSQICSVTTASIVSVCMTGYLY